MVLGHFSKKGGRKARRILQGIDTGLDRAHVLIEGKAAESRSG